MFHATGDVEAYRTPTFELQESVDSNRIFPPQKKKSRFILGLRAFLHT